MAAPSITTATKKYQSTTTRLANQIRRWFEIYTRKNLCWSLQPAALSKKRLQHSYFPVKLLKTGFFIELVRRTASRRAQDFTKTVPIPIPNDISKAYYQKEFAICFMRLNYSRFTEFLMETL